MMEVAGTDIASGNMVVDRNSIDYFEIHFHREFLARWDSILGDKLTAAYCCVQIESGHCFAFRAEVEVFCSKKRTPGLSAPVGRVCWRL